MCVIDIFGKYAWVVPLKHKKCVSIVDVFQKILDDSDRKQNKIWEENFTIILLKNGWKIMILGFIQHIMKENQLLLKDLLEFDKLDIDKLVPVPADLNKLNDVVKNDAVKRDVYNKLVTKVDNIDTSRFILKFKYDTDKSELEKKFLILVI